MKNLILDHGDRFHLYTRARQLLEDGLLSPFDGGNSGICGALSYAAEEDNRKYKDILPIALNIEAFPELARQNPNGEGNDFPVSYWWPRSFRGKEKRLEVLDICISESLNPVL